MESYISDVQVFRMVLWEHVICGRHLWEKGEGGGGVNFG